MKQPLLLLLTVALATLGNAQRLPLINSGEVLERAMQLQDSQKYELAVKQLLSVPKRDTNYVMSQSRLANLYLLSDQLELSEATANAVLRHPSEYGAAMWRVKANVYEKKKEYDKGLAIVDDALKKYPFDAELLYLRGILYHNKHDYKNAVKAYYSVLALAPRSTNAHLNLGNIALYLGDKTHAMMSLGMYVTLRNTNNEKLQVLESTASNQVEWEGKGATEKLDNNAYDRLDQILRSSVAMDKKFKTEVPINLATVKQFEMLLQQLNTASTTVDDPWTKFYGPIYAAIRDKKMVEPFLYHLLESTPIEDVKKWRSKHKKDLDAYYAVINPLLDDFRETIAAPQAFNLPSPSHTEYDKGTLDGIGGMSNGQRHGRWVWFHENNELSAEGNYNNGKKTGEWKYYSNEGIPLTNEDHDTGEITEWYPDGAKKIHYFTKNDAVEGDIVFYYPCGSMSEKRTHKDGKRTGKAQTWYENGTVKADFEYADDKLTNAWIDYDVRGKITSKVTYKDGVRDGTYERYWPNGKLREHENVIAGKTSGPSEGYHDNGTPRYKGQYSNDLPIGEWIYQNRKGERYEQRNYDAEGNLDKENIFSFEGKAYSKHTYKKGSLVQVAWIDGNGKEDKKFGSQDGTFDCKHYFPNGQLLSEGKYKNGKRDGKWTQYFIDGQLESVYMYVDGEFDGEQIDYYRSGIKSSVTQYANGVRDGYQQEFHPNGKLSSEGWQVAGDYQQQFLLYFADGTLAEDNYYRDGYLADTAYVYSIDGKLGSRVFYVEGTRTTEDTFDPLQRTFFMDPGTDGEQTLKYQSGSLLSKYSAKCGTLDGTIERFWPDGKKLFSYPYTNNEIYGVYSAYGIEGNLTETGGYLNGSQHGTWKYYNSAGKLNRISTYVNGTIDSLSTTFYAFGNVYQVSEFVDGKRSGLIRYLAPDGTPVVEKKSIWSQLMAVRTLEKSGQFGPWRPFSAQMSIVAYYPGGTKAYEEEYKDGTLSGAKRIYFPDGKLCLESHYVNGEEEGAFADYYPNGNVCMKGQYHLDSLEGVLEVYFENKTLNKTVTYKLGRKHGPSVYFKNGVKSMEVEFYNGLPLK